MFPAIVGIFDAHCSMYRKYHCGFFLIACVCSLCVCICMYVCVYVCVCVLVVCVCMYMWGGCLFTYLSLKLTDATVHIALCTDNKNSYWLPYLPIHYWYDPLAPCAAK